MKNCVEDSNKYEKEGGELLMAKRIAVIYQSKYGSTKRYAQWISEAVKGDLREGSKVKLTELLKYDIIVFGGSLHAGGIRGIKLINNNFTQLRQKKIIVFGVGASPIREEAINHVLAHNFTREIQETIHFFLLRGAFNYQKLSLGDKILMNALRLMLKCKKELDEDAKGLLACFNQPVDWTGEMSIVPLVACIEKLG